MALWSHSSVIVVQDSFTGWSPLWADPPPTVWHPQQADPPGPALHCRVMYHVMDGRGRSAFTLTKRTCWLQKILAPRIWPLTSFRDADHLEEDIVLGCFQQFSVSFCTSGDRFPRTGHPHLPHSELHPESLLHHVRDVTATRPHERQGYQGLLQATGTSWRHHFVTSSFCDLKETLFYVWMGGSKQRQLSEICTWLRHFVTSLCLLTSWFLRMSQEKDLIVFHVQFANAQLCVLGQRSFPPILNKYALTQR